MPLNGRFQLWRMRTPDPLQSFNLSPPKVAEFNTRVLPLRVLAAGREEDDGQEEGRPAAKRVHGVPLQEAIAGLCQFLGTHRQFVFVHGAAAAQAVLGQAARQYGHMIENPVGDVVDMARLAWPDRADYSLSGMAADLLSASLGPSEAPPTQPRPSWSFWRPLRRR